MLILLKLSTLKRYLLISLFLTLPIHAAEEKKADENLAAEVAGLAEPESTKPDREKEISTLIEKSFRGGEAVWLGDVDDASLALYKENTWKDTQGAILLLHDLGANADWPQLINPLRLAFPKKGWHTLSLQLPMVTPDVEKKVYLGQFDEAVARVGTGIEFLKQKNISNIVIVGHGFGSAIGIFYLSQNPKSSVSAMVAISLVGENTLNISKADKESEESITDPVDPDPGAQKQPLEKQAEKPVTEPPANAKELAEPPLPDRSIMAEMEKIKIPFLDIYGQLDHQDVIREAESRLELMQKADNPAFFQWKIEGADHYFRGAEKLMIKRLRGWLKKHAEGMEVTVP